MMTEEQAKTKWCPLARDYCFADDSSAVTINRWRGKPGVGSMCIGSECMAWQWAPGRPDNATSGEYFNGYCGAFGRSA